MKRIVWIFLGLIVVGFLGFQIYRRASAQSAGPAPGRFTGGSGGVPVAVEVAEVRRDAVRELGSFTGSLQPRARFVVAPKVGGRLDKLLVDVGDTVAAGQLVAELDGQEYAQQVDAARSDLTVAEANLEDARIALEASRRELERASALRDKLIASASEYEAAVDQLSRMEARYRLVQAQLQQKQGALEAAGTRLSYTRVRAAWEGGAARRVIGERFVDQGALLRANDPIVSVLDIGSLLAVINVTEESYARVRVGQPAAVTTEALPGKRFEGRVARIAPFLQESNRQAEVRIEVPNPDGALKPGMFVRVELVFGRRDNVVTIPASALISNRDRRGVFVVEGEPHRARFVPVTTGIVEGDRMEVVEPALSGLVVILGQHLLQDGARVLLPGEESAPPPGERPVQRAEAAGGSPQSATGARPDDGSRTEGPRGGGSRQGGAQ